MKVLAAAAFVALVAAGAASADVWHIQFTAAGQAAASAVVVTRADLGAASGWAGGSVKPDLSNTPPCTGFHPKQSDMTVTGAAETRWQHAGVQIDSEATVLGTPQMVELDWQRTVVAPQVTPCLREGLAKQVGSSAKLVSFGRVVPSYAPRTRAYRGVVEVKVRRDRSRRHRRDRARQAAHGDHAEPDRRFRGPGGQPRRRVVRRPEAGGAPPPVTLLLALLLAVASNPAIVSKPIPFDAHRRAEMAAYAQRHYGLHTWRLVHPHVIVEHYTANNSFSATWNTFASDAPDPELHERPGTCAHFVVDTDGTI
jgi:hypothetical protein